MDYNNDYNNYGGYGYSAPSITLNQYIVRTFLWMFAGLLLTFGVAWTGYTTGLILLVFSAPAILTVVTVAELALVIILAARVNKLSPGGARALFFGYAILNGVMFSAYFLIFEMTSLIIVFGLTALYFGVFAAFGHFTRYDLSNLRPLLMGGLIFLIVAGLISIFLPIGSLEKVISLVGIAVFVGFTAYDMQKIKQNYAYYSGDEALLEKASVFSALQLYLDFINLFLYLLRFMGKRKN